MIFVLGFFPHYFASPSFCCTFLLAVSTHFGRPSMVRPSLLALSGIILPALRQLPTSQHWFVSSELLNHDEKSTCIPIRIVYIFHIYTSQQFARIWICLLGWQKCMRVNINTCLRRNETSTEKFHYHRYISPYHINYSTCRFYLVVLRKQQTSKARQIATESNDCKWFQ